MMTNIAHMQHATRPKRESESEGFPDATEELLASEAFDADFNALRPRVEKLADLFTKVKVARVKYTKRIDITMSIEGINGRALHGFPQKGEIITGPGTESSIAPVEIMAEGKIVADVDIAGLGLVKEPVIVNVHEGFAKEINGGLDARNFRELLDSLKSVQRL